MAHIFTHEISQYLAVNLQSFRKLKNYTQADLAQKSGIPRSTLTNFESGDGNPSLSNLVKLSQALSVSLEELLQRPLLEVELIKKNEQPVKKQNQAQAFIYNLLPKSVPGLQLEKLEILPDGHLGGTPHLKGSKEYFACLQGQAKIYVAGEAFCLSSGDVLIFPGDEKHSYVNDGRSKLLGISVVHF